MKIAMVRFGAAREKGAMAFVEFLGISQVDTMEAPCGGRPYYAGAWGGMTRRNLSVGCIMAMASGKKPPASTPYIAQRRNGALSPTIGCSIRHWFDTFARAKSTLLLKTYGPSERELADKTAE